MKNTISLGIMAATILLAGCGKKDNSSLMPDDAVIRQKIVGTWKLNPDPKTTALLTVNSDGTLLGKDDSTPGGEVVGGTWKVTNGYFIVTMTNKNSPEPEIETNLVVQLNDHEWVMEDDGDTVTLHKQK